MESKRGTPPTLAADGSTITGENRANFLVFAILFLAGAGLFTYMQIQPAEVNALYAANSQTGLVTAEGNAQSPNAQAANPAPATADVQATTTPAEAQAASGTSAQYPGQTPATAEAQAASGTIAQHPTQTSTAAEAPATTTGAQYPGQTPATAEAQAASRKSAQYPGQTSTAAEAQAASTSGAQYAQQNHQAGHPNAQYPDKNFKEAENSNAQYPSSGADYYPTATPRAKLASSWINAPDGTLMECEVADTPAKREKGLMGRTYLAPSDCMLFVFERSDRYAFWMEDTPIPLDMVFLNANFQVVDVLSSVPACAQNPCTIYEPKTEARYVIEMNAGEAARRGIAEGKAITFASV